MTEDDTFEVLKRISFDNMFLIWHDTATGGHDMPEYLFHPHGWDPIEFRKIWNNKSSYELLQIIHRRRNERG